MRPFVAPGSIVRSIWGDADTILFVFARQAACAAACPCLRHDWIARTASSASLAVGQSRNPEGRDTNSERAAIVAEATFSIPLFVH